MKKNKRIKILLVDDEIEFVRTLSQRLTLRKLTVYTAYNGKEALSFINKTEPDVIVLDLKMPGLHGIEVLKKVKKNHPRIQVIILTGHGSKTMEKEAEKIGSFDFLHKPVNIDFLVTRIKEAYWEKVERYMTAAAMAESGDFDTARNIMNKKE